MLNGTLPHKKQAYAFLPPKQMSGFHNAGQPLGDSVIPAEPNEKLVFQPKLPAKGVVHLPFVHNLWGTKYLGHSAIGKKEYLPTIDSLFSDIFNKAPGHARNRHRPPIEKILHSLCHSQQGLPPQFPHHDADGGPQITYVHDIRASLEPGDHVRRHKDRQRRRRGEDNIVPAPCQQQTGDDGIDHVGKVEQDTPERTLAGRCIHPEPDNVQAILCSSPEEATTIPGKDDALGMVWQFRDYRDPVALFRQATGEMVHTRLCSAHLRGIKLSEKQDSHRLIV